MEGIRKRKRTLCLQYSLHDNLFKYEKTTDVILKAIDLADKQNKFKEKPIGPLGSCIKVKDYKWVKSIEQCLKGTMHAYVMSLTCSF